MKRTSNHRSGIAVFGMLVLAVLPAGCGSSSVPLVAPTVMFTYAPVTGPGPSVTTMLGAASTSGIAEIEIHVTDVLDVHSASFTLDFDPAVVSFLDFDAGGSHLSSDGAGIQSMAQQTRPGEVTVGVTRLGATGIDFNGARFLIRVRFVRVSLSGTSALTFGNNELLDPMAPPQPIAGIQWFGGTFQIN